VRQEIAMDRNGERSLGHKIKPQSGEEVNIKFTLKLIRNHKRNKVKQLKFFPSQITSCCKSTPKSLFINDQ
jgi:hypothetical protein